MVLAISIVSLTHIYYPAQRPAFRHCDSHPQGGFLGSLSRAARYVICTVKQFQYSIQQRAVVCTLQQNKYILYSTDGIKDWQLVRHTCSRKQRKQTFTFSFKRYLNVTPPQDCLCSAVFPYSVCPNSPHHPVYLLFKN